MGSIFWKSTKYLELLFNCCRYFLQRVLTLHLRAQPNDSFGGAGCKEVVPGASVVYEVD